MTAASQKSRRRKADRKGRIAELKATLHLRLKGYRILARRFKTPVGEVDLIARKSDVIVFVEVKARNEVATALDAITLTAQRRIEAAGDLYLSRRSDFSDLSWRYDVVVVLPFRWPIHMEAVW